MAAGADVVDKATGEKSSPEVSYYRRIDGVWRPRKELERLSIGERIFATRLLERDLLNGRTGPKVFLECGVGKRNNKGKWSIVNGMVRLGRRGMKKSVVRKKISKIPHNEMIEVYVSKINLDEGKLEVCLNREEAREKGALKGRTPASSFKVGDKLTGVVKQVKPYGVFVNVNNANRNGLIHISKVAKRYDAYVAKEDGMKKLGLSRGLPVDVIVLSNCKKRLELDLAPVFEESQVDADIEPNISDSTVVINDLSDDEAFAWAAYGADEGSERKDTSEEEAAMWASYAVDSSSNDIDEEAEYDEDTDIEDALGIGFY
eukprot:CAMPEP_0172567028 /NCGR_PEP_ID=MMETSP1067-20121228/114247_1 /TAXON_ID=265564 ORGANISM="Thalassiosira punctigera, Strain Tpunct2005C2" /NCGR_SAMPLE_ID=MMETSP1067 /ASSEMBLY_ACC=CAM_ASM_000444 /LENGTH=316 /DNA_ID=CAMNT_0013358281 /DNA_START=159 /DNA_END=1109 /DNA_ORIENTATION=+